MIFSQERLIAMILPLLHKYHAQGAILFGSYARNEADAQSDIDLIVLGDSSFDPTNVFCIADELHRIAGKQVDVYALQEIDQNSEFYRTILREGVSIAA